MRPSCYKSMDPLFHCSRVFIPGLYEPPQCHYEWQRPFHKMDFIGFLKYKQVGLSLLFPLLMTAYAQRRSLKTRRQLKLAIHTTKPSPGSRRSFATIFKIAAMKGKQQKSDLNLVLNSKSKKQIANLWMLDSFGKSLPSQVLPIFCH